MHPQEISSEEIWYSIQIFTVVGIVTNAIFYVSLFLFWDAPFMKGLADKRRMYIVSCIPSYIHAVISCAFATYALCTQTALYDDYVWGRSGVSTTACAITAGYMTGDLIITLMHWRLVGDFQFVIHHITSSAAFIYVCLSGSYSFFAMIRLLAEYSTIFVNNRAVFHDFGMQSGTVYFYNGLLMLFSFACARLAPFPWYLYCLYSITGNDSYNNSGLGRYIIWSSTVFLDSLNFIWFRKMVKGAIKVWNIHKHTHKNGENHLKGTKQG